MIGNRGGFWPEVGSRGKLKVPKAGGGVMTRMQQAAAWGVAGVVGVLACAGGAWAQTPLPLTNGGFENQNLFNSLEPEGWHNLSNPTQARYNKSGPARTGTRSVSIQAVPNNQGFRGWTTDTLNFFLPTFPFYDPEFNWDGGDVVVSGYYMIPADKEITGPSDRVGMKLNVKLGNQDYGTLDMPLPGESTNITGHTSGQWVQYTVTWPMEAIQQQVIQLSGEGYFTLPPYPDHLKITLGRFADRALYGDTISAGEIFWDDLTMEQTSAVGCVADYNRDSFLNLDDLGDFITDFYTVPAIPGGLQPSAPTYPDVATVGYGVACEFAGDAPSPYAIDAYRTNGFRVGYSGDGSNSCPLDPSQVFPNLDNLNDFITLYYSSTELPECGSPG
jgi:hypothetical protein